MLQCHAILKVLMSKNEAVAFNDPVDWQLYGLTDYPEIIKQPMDLGTILTNLESGKYATPDQFAKDVRLVWKNAMTYNRPDSDIYVTADKLKRLFERRFAKVKKAGSKSRRDGEQQVTRADQTRFASLASSLTSEELGKVVDMLQKECPEAITEDDDADDVEIEIGAIDGRTLLNLIAFAEECVNARKRRK